MGFPIDPPDPNRTKIESYLKTPGSGIRVTFGILGPKKIEYIPKMQGIHNFFAKLGIFGYGSKAATSFMHIENMNIELIRQVHDRFAKKTTEKTHNVTQPIIGVTNSLTETAKNTQSLTELPKEIQHNTPGEVHVLKPEDKKWPPELSPLSQQLVEAFTTHGVANYQDPLKNLINLMSNTDLDCTMRFLPDKTDKISRIEREAISLFTIAVNSPEVDNLRYVSLGSGGLLQDLYNLLMTLALQEKKESVRTWTIDLIDTGYLDTTPILGDKTTDWKLAVQEFTNVLQVVGMMYNIQINVRTYSKTDDVPLGENNGKINILSAIRLPPNNEGVRSDWNRLQEHTDPDKSLRFFLSDFQNEVKKFERSFEPTPTRNKQKEPLMKKGFSHAYALDSMINMQCLKYRHAPEKTSAPTPL